MEARFTASVVKLNFGRGTTFGFSVAPALVTFEGENLQSFSVEPEPSGHLAPFYDFPLFCPQAFLLRIIKAGHKQISLCCRLFGGNYIAVVCSWGVSNYIALFENKALASLFLAFLIGRRMQMQKAINQC